MLSRFLSVRRSNKTSDAISTVESLESRVLLSAAEQATAQLQLLSTSGSAPPVYSYGVTLNNTGSGNLGTFWFAWLPLGGFLPSTPTSLTSPAGWTPMITDGPGGANGFGIQWVANNAGADVSAGNSLAGFGFSSVDSPTVLDGVSLGHAPTPILESTVYSGTPFSDAGDSFVVSGIAVAQPAPSTTALATSNASINAGDSVTFTATVAPATTGATPTGTVTFSQSGTTLNTAPVQGDGTAVFITAALQAGSDPIIATYSGDANYTASMSMTVTETVNTVNRGAVATTTTVNTSVPQIAVGDAVAFIATIASPSGSTTPTGTVSFFDGATSLGTIDVAVDGTALLSTMSLAAGTHSITATYSGDATHLASAAPAITETVTGAVVNPATLTPTIGKSTVPAAIVAGGKTHGVVSVDVSNQTAAAIKGKTTVDLFATTDGVIDGSAILVGAVTRTLNIKTGVSKTVPVKTTPALTALAAGTYTLLARTTDLSSNSSDSTTGPTVQVAASFISFSETFAKLTLPASVTSGAKTHGAASLQITNSGNVQSTGTTMISFYVSTDGLVDSTATLIQTTPKTLKIKPGASKKVSLPIKLFPTVTAGNYSIVAQVIDPQQQTTTVVSGASVSVS